MKNVRQAKNEAWLPPACEQACLDMHRIWHASHNWYPKSVFLGLLLGGVETGGIVIQFDTIINSGDTTIVT